MLCPFVAVKIRVRTPRARGTEPARGKKSRARDEEQHSPLQNDANIGRLAQPSHPREAHPGICPTPRHGSWLRPSPFFFLLLSYLFQSLVNSDACRPTRATAAAENLRLRNQVMWSRDGCVGNTVRIILFFFFYLDPQRSINENINSFCLMLWGKKI